MKVAVVGATGLVGSKMLEVLAQRNFPVTELIPVASEKSVGKTILFKDIPFSVCDYRTAIDAAPALALFSAGGSTSLELAPRFAEAGITVIDNSSAWRMDPRVPLIVPEVNPDAVSGYDKLNIVANPNCSTAQLVVALKPLHEKAVIKRVVVSTYQSVSGAGKEAMDELFTQTRALLTTGEVKVNKFPKRIAFNLIPHIDVFMNDGFTKEEWKMSEETKKTSVNMPRAIILSMAISTILYVLISVVAVKYIPIDQLKNSNAPLSLVFGTVTSSPAWIITIIALTATAGGVLAHVLSGSRLLYGMAEAGWLNKRLAVVHESRKTPTFAILVVVLLSSVLAIFLDLTFLASATSYLILIIFSLVNTSLIRIKLFRRKRKKGVFTVPALVPVMGLIFCLILIFTQTIDLIKHLAK
jgi:hypothetical protein